MKKYDWFILLGIVFMMVGTLWFGISGRINSLKNKEAIETNFKLLQKLEQKVEKNKVLIEKDIQLSSPTTQLSK
jgi:hypothetical protein